MPRFWTFASCWAACLSLAMAAGALAAAEGRRSETLLPNTTQGCVAISNVDTLEEHWNQTQLGHLMADPVMKPFTKDMKRQVEERWSSVQDRLGISLDDMKGVPGGDVAIGLIAPEPGKAAVAIVIDVTGKLKNAREMLVRVNKRQLERGAKRSEVTVKGCPDAVIRYQLPQSEDERDARQSGLPGGEKPDAKNATAEQESPARLAFYCLTGNLLVIADDLGVAESILARGLGIRKEKDSLADHKPFQMVMKRCRADYGVGTPQVRWYLCPLGYAAAARAATPEGQRRKGKTLLEVMQHQGVAAVQGVGGLVDFSSEGYELIHRTAIYAPGPFEKAMKMAVLPNKTDFAPQSWVPRDVATYTTFYFDILNAFDNFGSIFDELFGQGEPGTWEDTKQSLKEDPSGPQVDLREDLIRHLGQRVSMLTDYEEPITTSSERLFFAIEVKNPDAVALAIKKLLVSDPTFKCRKVKGHVVWEMVQEESPELKNGLDIDLGQDPAVTEAHPLKRRKTGSDDEQEERKPLLPHAAVTVWNGNLVIASHMDFLLKVIAPEKKIQLLSADLEYQLVQQEIKKAKSAEKCFQFFSRTDEEYRPTYELVRQNKLPESESLFARALNVLFGEGKKGARRPKLDGSQLPEYKAVRPYLGPAGFRAVSESDGWFLKGFTLTKPVEADKAPLKHLERSKAAETSKSKTPATVQPRNKASKEATPSKKPAASKASVPPKKESNVSKTPEPRKKSATESAPEPKEPASTTKPSEEQ
ncbi:MAG: hypothetical protein ABFC63_07965 [Thermoguttaceae bacterium]